MKNNAGHRVAAAAAGLSLIELMIALLISSILLIGVIQVFAASRTAYQLSQGIARNQENGRFAMDFLTRDIRMAGHAGCVNDQVLLSTDASGKPTGGNVRSLFLAAADRNSNTVANQPFPLRFDVSIQGFEAAGTQPGGALTLPVTPIAGQASDWSPALPNELSGLGPIKGSDIIMLRTFSPIEEMVTGFAPASNPSISYPDESVAGNTKVATGGAGLYAIADCKGATVFQASAAPTATGMRVAIGGLNKTDLSFLGTYDGALAFRPGNASLFRAESVAYYVALNAQTNTPSLYRARWTSAPGAASLTTTTEEMVEGVESLQLAYGEDSAPLTGPPTGYINNTNTADVLGGIANAPRWRRVGTVQVGLLVRGASSETAATQQAAAKPSVLAVTVTPPSDGQYRSVYETTVALRNRLFGN
ncbi:pilus assembly protein PilW [Xanthomonas arboricola pv. populi]|uniref:Pilus assembly protein PilW n=1 Tax=Xanthomonas arboricola pv. populi TaxID=487823 RepID=A0A2S6Z1Q9_9XANT|nr:PilW family protein [Xanthomonas arboricola]PPT74715.1 pilus assembly protein PilW [Xanthomonas arboricola pv. populi]